MLFVSTSFLFIFLPSLLVLTWFLKRRYFNTVLLMGSLFFYWVGNGFFLIIILYIGILLYFQIKYDYFSNRATISLILTPLLWFKYSSFAVDMLSKIFDLNMNTYSGELPLGISFFTFQSIAYYIDTKTGAIIGTVVFLFFSYFFIPTFYNKSEIKKLLVNQTLNKYDINVKFNEKIKYGLFPKPFFYTKNLHIIFEDEVLGKWVYSFLFGMFHINQIRNGKIQFLAGVLPHHNTSNTH